MTTPKKYNLVVPLAGKGQRMIDGGFVLPKPMIFAGHQSILQWSMQSIDYSKCNLIFIVRREHVENWFIENFLFDKFPGCRVHIVDKDTKGAIDSVMKVEHIINCDMPLIVYCPDVYFEPKFDPENFAGSFDGVISTFKANSTNYSYVETDPCWGHVIRTAEKKVISNEASVGIYCFKSGRVFCSLAKNHKYEKEAYVCPLYNDLIEKGGKVITQPVKKIYIMGTPEEYNFFVRAIYPYLQKKRHFLLCSDHSGFNTKNVFKNIMDRTKTSYTDCGCYDSSDCDYNKFVNSVCNEIKKTSGCFGIGFCRSGQGVNICANKHSYIRGALISDGNSAKLAINHNAANFFSVPENVQEEEEIIKALKEETFDGGRHQNRMMNNE